MKHLAIVVLALLIVGAVVAPAAASEPMAPDGPVPDYWVLEGTEGTSAEYIYPTGTPGEGGYPVGWDFGGFSVMDVEPGPPVPSGYFAWVAPSSVTTLNDVYNIPRYSASLGARIHRGLDIGSKGLAIYAAYGAVVDEKWTHADAGHTSDTTWGTYARLWTDYGLNQSIQHLYGHWATFTPASQATVTKGQQVGTIGDGHGLYVGAEHLHFGVLDAMSNFISPAPYFSTSNPVPRSAMEFIVHTPITRFTPGSAVSVSFTSGRADQVDNVLPNQPMVYYRAYGSGTWTTGTMTKSGSTWSYSIPGSFTSTCTQFQYYLKVCRVYNANFNPTTGNYSTRPVYDASTPPPTPYLVSSL